METVQDFPRTLAIGAPAEAFRTLLVHVQPHSGADGRLSAAVHLARKLDATLFGVAAETVQPAAYTDPGGMTTGDLIVAARQLVTDNLKRAEAEFKTETAGLRTHWVATEAIPGDLLPLLARRADLIIAGGAPMGDTSIYRAANVGDLVLQSGRPVLVVPAKGGRLKAEAIVVGWKDTRESRRAIADSMPFLRAAEIVVVFEAYEHEDDADNARIRTSAVVDYLKTHGVSAIAKIDRVAHDQTAQAIEAAARAIDADLIVTGAYGHSRIGERVFGGVTRDLLRDADAFVLMSH
jgi:nucleotide-binding universal stress UspA family protein